MICPPIVSTAPPLNSASVPVPKVSPVSKATKPSTLSLIRPSTPDAVSGSFVSPASATVATRNDDLLNLASAADLVTADSFSAKSEEFTLNTIPSVDSIPRDCPFLAVQFQDHWSFGNISRKGKKAGPTITFTATSTDGVSWQNMRNVMTGSPEVMLEGCLDIFPSKVNYQSLKGPLTRPRYSAVVAGASAEQEVFDEVNGDVVTIHHPELPDVELDVPLSVETGPEDGPLQGYFNEQASVPPVFQAAALSLVRRGVPAADLSSERFVSLVAEPAPSNLPPPVLEALVKSTYQEHRRVISLMAARLSLTNAREKHAVLAFINALTELKAERKWKASTLMHKAASLQGALKLFPIYHQGAPCIMLTDAPQWRLACRKFQQDAREEKPVQARPATWAEVKAAINKANSSGVKVALLLGWLTASRLGCILSLAPSDVVINRGFTLSITFYRGKGVKARGPYTVHTAAVPPVFRNMLKRHLEERLSRVFPRHLKGSSLKDALRAVNVKLEQRSIRRGALQTMALNGSDEKTLMLYSGHTQVSTLRRYLNWNAVNSKTQQTMAKDGAVLTSPTSKRK